MSTEVAIPVWFAELARALGPASVLRCDEPLGRRTTMGIGGRAAFYAEPADEAALTACLAAAQAAHLPIFIIGRGSNLLVVDGGYPGLVIRLADGAWQRIERLDTLRLRVAAGVRLKKLCADAAGLGLAGLEFLEGIPGSLGGALRMNAGAMGRWMFDVVESVRLVGADGRIAELTRAQVHAEYRACRELVGAYALSAVLRADGERPPAEIRAAIDAYALKRRASQPREPSAGCIFKNPEGDHAGRIIDQLGLKGRRVGDAEVSPVHGNFIVNRGQATCADVVQLVREIRAEVQARRGIDLHPEVLLVGATWEEIL